MLCSVTIHACTQALRTMHPCLASPIHEAAKVLTCDLATSLRARCMCKLERAFAWRSVGSAQANCWAMPMQASHALTKCKRPHPHSTHINLAGFEAHLSVAATAATPTPSQNAMMTTRSTERRQSTHLQSTMPAVKMPQSHRPRSRRAAGTRPAPALR